MNRFVITRGVHGQGWLSLIRGTKLVGLTTINRGDHICRFVINAGDDMSMFNRGGHMSKFEGAT